MSDLNRWLLPVLFSMLLAVPAYAVTVEEARTAEYEGRWDDAVGMWSELALAGTDERGTQTAVVNHLRVLWTLRRTEGLLRAAEQASSTRPGWDVPVIYRARALAAEQKLDDALQLLQPFVGTSRTATAVRARLLQDAGRRAEARATWESLTPRTGVGSALSPADRFALAQAAEALGEFSNASTLLQTAMADSLDFLEARLALCMLFQEKYQAQLAADELNDAAKLGPQHPDVHLTRTQLLLLNNQLQNAEEAANQVLTWREDPVARTILARLDNIAEQPEQALTETARVLKAHPGFAPALYEAAAAHYLAGDSTAYHAAVERVLARDPEDVTVYLVLGDLMEMARRNEEAFAMYRQVLVRQPDHPRALTDMGLLAMREGDEVTARDLLERGFAGDSFNIKAYNQLQLLDEMDTYTKYTTEHFEIRLKATEDSLLVPILMESLEATYEDLVALHGAAPRNTTIVEVFPTHSWFSARVTGLPWIGGIPAVCFGDVVAMDSPRTLAGRMNWEQIVRHEFGHVLALDMTNKKVPFWFTEGLSVYLEQYPRSMRWDENLRAAYVDGGLVPVDSLTLAFTRPRDMDQRLLAYHEAGLVLEDLVARHGWDAVPKLLHAFGDGQTLETAIESVLGESYAEFAQQSLAHVERVAAALPVWPRPDPKRVDRMTKVVEMLPEDADFLELLAISQVQLSQFDDATATAKRVLALNPRSGTAYAVLGIADDTRDRKDASRRHLEQAIENGSTDLPAYQLLGQHLEAARETEAALKVYAQALEIYPGFSAARLRRARMLRASGDTTAAMVEYRALMEQIDDAGTAAEELARMEIAQGDGAAAARSLDYAVGVNPLSADVEALRGQAYLMEGRADEAFARFQRARRIDLSSVEAMVGMAMYYLGQEDFEEALYFADLALKYDPTHPGARRVRDTAEAW